MAKRVRRTRETTETPVGSPALSSNPPESIVFLDFGDVFCNGGLRLTNCLVEPAKNKSVHLPVGAFTTIDTYVPESGHVTDRLRFAVLMRDGFKCTACHEVASARPLVVRLIVSDRDGGTRSLDNLNTVCRRCNNIGTADRE